MIRNLPKTAVLAALLAWGGLEYAARPALAQGPYGRNTYADFPYNQGSMAYRPLKPGVPPNPIVGRPAPRVVNRSYYAAPAPGVNYTYPTPYGYQAPQAAPYGYYYPAQQGWYYVQPPRYGYR